MVSRSDPSRGEGIVIFAAQSKTDGGIFKPGLLRRSGLMDNYTRSVLDSYQISYWASPLHERCSPDNGANDRGAGGATPRRTATLRKNAGFRLLSIGADNPTTRGLGSHRVRILKVGGKIQLEAAGTIALRFENDAKTYGAILREGHIALVQSARSGLVTYRDLKVWRIGSKSKAGE